MRIGDLMVLGEKEYVFGQANEEISNVSLRSHGSLYETEIPIVINKKSSELEKLPQENKDLIPLVFEWLKGAK